MPTHYRGIQIKALDTREITVPVPASAEDTNTLGEFISEAFVDGYALKKAATIPGGSQRDPWTVGIKLTFERVPS